jgi:hypothetical protein
VYVLAVFICLAGAAKIDKGKGRVVEDEVIDLTADENPPRFNSQPSPRRRARPLSQLASGVESIASGSNSRFFGSKSGDKRKGTFASELLPPDKKSSVYGFFADNCDRILKLFSNACQKLDFSKMDCKKKGTDRERVDTNTCETHKATERSSRRSESPDTKTYRSILEEHDSSIVVEEVKKVAPIRRSTSFGGQGYKTDGEEGKGRTKGLSFRKSLSFH